MDSTGALDLPDIPNRCSSSAAATSASSWASSTPRSARKVTVVEMTPGLLPGADRDLVNILAKRIETICEASARTKVTGMKAGKDGIAVTFEGEGAPAATDVRSRPGVDRPQAELHDSRPRQAAVESTSAASSSSTPAADGRADHLRDRRRRRRADARAQGVARRRASRSTRSRATNVAFEPAAIPAVVFTDPEIAWAGLTETDAEKQGTQGRGREFPWGASGRAISLGRTDGVTKLVIDPETERVLGVGICGPAPAS